MSEAKQQEETASVTSVRVQGDVRSLDAPKCYGCGRDILDGHPKVRDQYREWYHLDCKVNEDDELGFHDF